MNYLTIASMSLVLLPIVKAQCGASDPLPINLDAQASYCRPIDYSNPNLVSPFGFVFYEASRSIEQNYEGVGFFCQLYASQCHNPFGVEDINSACQSGCPSGTGGDPHFTMFTGRKFDFHGECDMVLLNHPSFNNGQGLRIHIRTHHHRRGSHVQAVAMRLGSDTLEVVGGANEIDYWVNGVAGSRLTKKGSAGFTIGGNDVRFRILSRSMQQLLVPLGDGASIIIRSVKGWMKVDLKHHTAELFGSSEGVLGNYTTGEMMSRTGAILNDPDQFGLEWQVLSSEPMLFHDIKAPQHPRKCKMPSASTMQGRRLGEQRVSRLAAKQACAQVSDPESKANCVFDVMAGDDVEMAGTYFEF